MGEGEGCAFLKRGKTESGKSLAAQGKHKSGKAFSVVREIKKQAKNGTKGNEREEKVLSNFCQNKGARVRHDPGPAF